MAPSAAADSSSSEDDDNDVNVGLAIGLAVPLGLLTLFVLVYFAWYQNSCGIFGKKDKELSTPLIEDGGSDTHKRLSGSGAETSFGDDMIAKESGSSKV